ncbi:uncharacterized protein BJ212DRAFT_207212 [Suillus subaureus]|uniref:Uncharacterized protein n=1 Tax=Suillus subaureus TaxID=48587 RepID=A0A9P7EB32_9AGAM|nr:uncharacterized protein BJ212DRAFT_207212 [Suillus subaureus]KAG1816006.1 hypothetical protein BJ212DRAFT_207212 [Suillus subaureus]
MQLQGSLDAHTYNLIVVQVLVLPNNMSVIEKLQETSASGSITTLFRLGPVDAISSLPIKPPGPFYSSEVAGLSWCLTIRTKKINKEKQHQLCFNSRSCPDAWRGTLAKVTVSFPSHPDGDPSLCTTSITVILGLCGLDSDDNHPLVTGTCSSQKLGNALVSLEVTLTNTLSCNPFDVPAPVRSVPDAPASAEAPRVSQACSALRALEQSLKTGTSFDIVFQAYTHRLSLGKVTRPIPIYASTAVLQTTLPDFSGGDLDLSSLFELSEGDTLPFTSLESYEYDSDSDLDDDDFVKNNINPTPVDNESYEDTTDTGSISSFSSIEAGLREQLGNRPLLLEDVGIVPAVISENLKRGSRVILVKGVAWKTWHAFIYYCYTGIVNFVNLRSQGTPDEQRRLEDGPPHCSPKSMYQLARKLQLNNEPLSRLALKAIETRLSAANILNEAFSKFTSRHDAVRAMETALLLKHRNASEVLQGLPAKMEAVARGNIPNAGQVLTALIMQIPGQN